MQQPENIVEISIPRPDSSALVNAQTLLSSAESYAVTTPAQYEEAASMLKHIKGKAKDLDEERKAMTKPLDDSKKRIMEFFSKPLDFLARAEHAVKRGMIAYTEEQDRLRREEQRKADEAARKEQDRLKKQAEKAAAAGKTEKAQEIEQRAEMVVAPVISREPPKIAGQSMREAWLFEVTDPSLVPREYMSVDEKKIRGVVQSLKGETKIPGVRVYSEKRLASGSY